MPRYQRLGIHFISIHALRKESDDTAHQFVTVIFGFQSTLSVRRATDSLLGREPLGVFQSTLSVRRATRNEVSVPSGDDISIHALRKESDLPLAFAMDDDMDFNPRSP